jgi:polygalacturonase
MLSKVFKIFQLKLKMRKLNFQFISKFLLILSLVSNSVLSQMSITKFGALGDGKKLNTKSIQNAINACAKKGGGTVFVPAGIFLTGSIELKSNITLELASGAVLLGSPDIADYPFNGFKHNEMGETKSLIWAINQQNISITGNGKIDFNGKVFMDFNSPKSNLEIEKTNIYTDLQKKEVVVKYLKRPNQPLFFHNCRNITVKDVSMTDAPCWTFTLSECEKVRITSIHISNDPQISNSDGIHISASKDVIISNSLIFAGDDCIALTCITAWDKTCENIVITNCVFSSRSAGVRVGHQASKISNVIASNLVMRDCNRGIAIFSGDKGFVKDISFNEIIMQTQKFAGAWWGKGEPLVVVTHKDGKIENVSIRNVKADAENSIIIYGEGVKGLLLENWNLLISQGLNINHFKPLYELSPAPFINSPDPLTHIPCVYVEKATGVVLKDIKAKASFSNTPFSITPLVIESAEVKFENTSIF